MTEDEEDSLLMVLGSRIPSDIPRDVQNKIIDGIVTDLKELGWGILPLPD